MRFHFSTISLRLFVCVQTKVASQIMSLYTIEHVIVTNFVQVAGFYYVHNSSIDKHRNCLLLLTRLKDSKSKN